MMSKSDCLKEYPWLSDWLANKNHTIFRVTDFLMNSRKYCKFIESQAAENGVTFKYNSAVEEVVVKNNQATGVRLSNGEVVPADIVVLCCALWTANFKCISSNIHMLPMRGASLDLHQWNMKGKSTMVQVSDYTSGDLNFQLCPLGTVIRVSFSLLSTLCISRH